MNYISTLAIIATSSLLFACSNEEPEAESESHTAAADSGNAAALKASLQIEDEYMRGIIQETLHTDGVSSAASASRISAVKASSVMCLPPPIMSRNDA